MTGCKAPARVSGVVKAGELGCDKAHTAGGKYGTKLRKIVERIEAIPEDDRIIVFVQVSQSCTSYKIATRWRFLTDRILLAVYCF